MRLWVRVMTMGMEPQDEVSEILQRWNWQDLANYGWWQETKVKDKRFHVCVRTWVHTINWIRKKKNRFGGKGGKLGLGTCPQQQFLCLDNCYSVNSGCRHQQWKVPEGECLCFYLQSSENGWRSRVERKAGRLHALIYRVVFSKP